MSFVLLLAVAQRAAVGTQRRCSDTSYKKHSMLCIKQCKLQPDGSNKNSATLDNSGRCLCDAMLV
jgi:hypothetical protein